jgi:small subunit ribosomal protein S2
MADAVIEANQGAENVTSEEQVSEEETAETDAE